MIKTIEIGIKEIKYKNCSGSREEQLCSVSICINALLACKTDIGMGIFLLLQARLGGRSFWLALLESRLAWLKRAGQALPPRKSL